MTDYSKIGGQGKVGKTIHLGKFSVGLPKRMRDKIHGEDSRHVKSKALKEKKLKITDNSRGHHGSVVHNKLPKGY